MKLKFLSLFLIVTSFVSAFEAKLTFTAIPSTAKIYFNGELRGTGTATYELERAILVEVKIVNEGYITFAKSYRYGKGSQFATNEGRGGYERGKNEYTITLDKDPNYVTPEKRLNQLNKISSVSDSLNKFIAVTSKYNAADSWKMINQVVSDYFDDMDGSNAETGTLKTTWQTQIIDKKKIRIRAIVKTNSENSYKLKMQVEYSDDENASAKEDERFKEWDRIPKKYQAIFSDLNNKLK